MSARGLTDLERARLVAIYLPYLLMPLALMWRAAARPAGMFAPPLGGGAARGASLGAAPGPRLHGDHHSLYSKDA